MSRVVQTFEALQGKDRLKVIELFDKIIFL